MFVSLYTSRVILNTLGVEDYGIYNVVGGVVTMFAFFNSAMSSATQRFLSFEIGKGDFIQLRKTFNATQIIHIGIAILVFILAETIGLWFVKTYLVIPPERLEAAVWVYHFSVLSFMVSIIQVPYNATIIAHERMNVYAYVSIIEVLLKLLIVFMLTWITYDKLKLFGVLYFAVVFVIAAIYRIYTRKNFEETKFEVVRDKKLYKTLVSYSGWNLFGSLAGVAQGQGVNILLNMFFGPVANAARGIAMQVQSAVSSFVNNFQMAINPQIVKSFASDEKVYMYSLINRSAKLSFFLISLISIPILIEVELILKIWLTNVPEYTVVFSSLSIILALLWPLSNPLMMAIQATGNIRRYQLVTGVLMFSIFPFSYLFFKFSFPPVVAYYIAIATEIFSFIARLYFANKLLGFSIVHFLKNVIVKVVYVFFLSLLVPLSIKSFMVESVFRLLLIVFTSLTWSTFIIYIYGLSGHEKLLVRKLINRIIKK